MNSALGIANAEAEDDYMLADALTPRKFAEMMDLDVEVAKLLYGAYGIKNEEYGHVIGNLDNYEVPLIDMFLFVHEEADKGYVELDDEMQRDLDDAYEKIDDARKQLQGEKLLPFGTGSEFAGRRRGNFRIPRCASGRCGKILRRFSAGRQQHQ